MKHVNPYVKAILLCYVLTVFIAKGTLAQYTKLLDFNGTNQGGIPRGSLTLSDGILYGMTSLGGADSLGTIFKINLADNSFTKLVDFDRVSKGSQPFGSLVVSGNVMYGTTFSGGAKDSGIIFKVNTDGSGFNKLIDFDTQKGAWAIGSLILSNNILYGTTVLGSVNNAGTVFKVNIDGSGFSHLVDFDTIDKGMCPFGALTLSNGVLYGMTSLGGKYGNRGTIFKVNTDNSGFSKLFDFNDTLGSGPNGSLVISGNTLYGMTSWGGKNGKGVIFKINTDGSGFSKLFDFDNTSGVNPNGSLIISGNVLYGMTLSGGTNNSGTAFKINTDGTGFFKFIDFDGTSKGSIPLGDLTQSGNVLYGMTASGGANTMEIDGTQQGIGVIFKYMFTSQTITFNPLSPKIKGDPDFGPGAIASSGLPVKYSSSDTTVAKIINNNIHILKEGSCTIFADQPGNETFFSALQQAQTLIIDPATPPSVPAGLNGFSIHNSKAVLNWTANTEGHLAAYKIYGHPNPSSLIATVNAPITTFTDTNLIDDTTYMYRISAVNTAGDESAKSDPISISIPVEAPLVFSYFPANGAVGSSVTITGLNFAAIPTSNKVFFGATHAQVTSATKNQLVVTVPAGATFQPISVTNLSLFFTGYANIPFSVTFGPEGGQPLTNSSFGPNVNIGSNSIPSSIAISDLDGDGKPDLIVTNQGSNKISVYRNISISGSITSGSFAAKIDFTTPTGPLKVIIADIDGDGRPDMIVANSNNSLSVFKNVSTPGSITTASFAPRVNFNTFAGANTIVFGDLDGDGKTDLIVGGGTQFSLLHNISTEGIIDINSFEHGVLFSSANAINSMAIGDLDNDGKPDVAFTTAANTVSVFKNIYVRGPIATTSFAPEVNFPVGSGPRDVKIADLDDDGKLELATINFGGGSGTSVSVLHNISSAGTITSGSFEPEIEFATSLGSSSLAIGDVNGDGKPELATVANGSNVISVLLNRTSQGIINNGSFAPKIDFALAAGAVPNALTIGDLNADGKPELCAATTVSIGVLQNNLSGSTPASPVSMKDGPENLLKKATNAQSKGTSITALTSDEIKLYPNPSSGKVKIELPNADPSSITILDMGMKVIKEGDYHQSLIVLDISDIAYGFYLVQIRQGVRFKTLKMEKIE